MEVYELVDHGILKYLNGNDEDGIEDKDEGPIEVVNIIFYDWLFSPNIFIGNFIKTAYNEKERLMYIEMNLPIS